MKIAFKDIRHLAIIGAAGAAGVAATLVVLRAAERPHVVHEVVTVEARRAPIVHVRSNVHVVKPSQERSGEEATVRLRRIAVRGPESMEPVVYVDGIRTNALEDLTPEDIDRVEVLKGPKAVELYGSEGENGVIVVTTKTGKKKAEEGTEKQR